MNLSEIDWGAVIDATSVIVTIIIALIVYRQANKFHIQEKKISELVDMVNELKKANILMNKRYNLEKQNSDRKVMPWFRGVEKKGISFRSVSIKLINKGDEAIFPHVVSWDENLVNVETKQHVVRKDSVIEFVLTYEKIVSHSFFVLQFRNNYGNTYTQKIFIGEAIDVHPPKEIN